MSGRTQQRAVGVAPAVTAENRRFWEAAGRGELVVEYCGGCARHLFPPRGYCPGCGGRELDEVALAGPGVVYSFTVNWNAWQAAMEVPFALVLVEFPEAPGVRLLGRLQQADLDDLRIGQAVSIGFDDGPGGMRVPSFRPAGPPP